MCISFLLLNKDDLLSVLQHEPAGEIYREQIAEYFQAVNCRTPYEDEDVVVWFLDNHAFHEKDQRWHYIL